MFVSKKKFQEIMNEIKYINVKLAEANSSLWDNEYDVWNLKNPYGRIRRFGESIYFSTSMKAHFRLATISIPIDSPVHYSVIKQGNIFYVLLTYEKDNKKVSEVYAVIGNKAELTTEYPDFNKPDMKGTL